MKKEWLRFRNLAIDDYDYGILQDASFVLYEAETVAFVGLINSGIKAIEKLFEGDVERYEGRIILEGQEKQLNSLENVIHNGIYCINSKPRLIKQMSLIENLFLGTTPRYLLDAVDRDGIEKEYQELFQTYGIDPEIKDIEGLDQFTEKKIEIIRCISHGARMIVFSDVNEYCDYEDLEELKKIFRDLNDRGICVAYFMDDMFGRITDAIDRIIVFRKGISSTVIEDQDKVRDYDHVVHAIFGRDFIKREGHVSRTDENKSLRIIKDEKELLNVKGGELIALVDRGRFSSGASHLEVMEELQKEYQFYVNDKKIDIHEMKDFVKQKIALIIKEKADSLAADNLSPADNATILTMSAGKRFLYEKGVSEYLFETVVSEYPILKNCKDIIEDKDCYGLSYEQRFEIMLARWLIIDPDVVVFFWPLGNNDSRNAERYYELAAGLADQGKIVIMTADRESYFREGFANIYYI